MRSLFLILLLVGTAHGLFGTLGQLVSNVGDKLQSVTNLIGQSASNLWNGATGHVNNVIGNVVDSAGNVYGQLVSTANGVQFASNFLWDNVFGPAFDMMVEGGQLFIDDKFGNILSGIGRRSIVPENILSEKYAEITAHLKSSIHQLYEDLFTMQKETLLAFQKGEHNLEDKIRAFYNKIAEIHKQIQQWATEAKYELEMHALTVQGDWVHILKQYSQNIDLSIKTMSAMFQQLAQDLMKNLLEVALSVVPNALAIVENMKQQGLLSFLHH